MLAQVKQWEAEMLGETRAEAIEATENSSNSFWRKLTVYGAVALALTGLYDPLKDIYVRYANPDLPGTEPVAVALEQQRLTEKNLDCLREAQQFKVQLSSAMEVRLLACQSGDVQIVLYPQDAPARQRWITTRGTGGYASIGSLDWLVGRAMAQAQGTAPNTTFTQSVVQNVCQAWQDVGRKAKLVRVTNEGGKCYKEIVNVFSGRVEYREETACTTGCTG